MDPNVEHRNWSSLSKKCEKGASPSASLKAFAALTCGCHHVHGSIAYKAESTADFLYIVNLRSGRQGLAEQHTRRALPSIQNASLHPSQRRDIRPLHDDLRKLLGATVAHTNASPPELIINTALILCCSPIGVLAKGLSLNPDPRRGWRNLGFLPLSLASSTQTGPEQVPLPASTCFADLGSGISFALSALLKLTLGQRDVHIERLKVILL